jgi:hypothetical protein
MIEILPLCGTLGAFPDFDDWALTAESADYSIFGIPVDRKHVLQWLFSQEKATLHALHQDHINSENALGLSLRRLLRVIERMYRLNLSIDDVNPVKNVIQSINSLHVEDGCNVISLDDVLL